MYIGLIDKYGTLVGTATNSKLTIQIDASYKNSSEAKTYAPTVAGTTNFFSERGVFKIENLQFTGTPGANYKLKFFTDAIDMNKPSNKEVAKRGSKGGFLESTSTSSSSEDSMIDFSLDLQVRKC